MVNTKKFSEFVSADLNDPDNTLVGLSGGANAISNKVVVWDTATRPSAPFNGILGYNTDLSSYEYWDSVSSQWFQLGTGDTGTVTEVNTGTGLTGGPITDTGTISFAPIAAESFWANTTGSSAVPAETLLSILLLSANNLSDVPNKATARTNLGLQIGLNVEAWSAVLDSIAGLGKVPLNLGGTNANLTASNGGIFYSTATAGAILSGTATARQMLQSGASSAPAWSTTTWPATSTINQLLYSSAANVISGLSTVNNATLATSNTGVPAWLGPMTNGQLLIGSTGSTPDLSTLTAGSNITIANGPGTITISATGILAPALTDSHIFVGNAANVATDVPLSGDATMANTGAITVTKTNGVLFAPSATTDTTNASNITSGLLAMSVGGTNKNMTADNGAIVYSDADSLELLASTATAGQIVRSGSNAAPSWSTATYPATTTANQILYSSATNVISEITTANDGTLITSGAGVPSISSTLPDAVQDNITRLGTQVEALDMGSHQINNLTDPTLAQDAATKNYVDSIAQGITVQGACRLGTTTALTATYNNGTLGVGATLTNAGAQVALSLDGVATVVGNRVLIKDQAAPAQNGIYTVTDIGSGATNWVLTRATDYDQASEVNPGDLVIITAGNTLTQSSWIETATVTIMGTDAINFSQFSASLPISLANGGTSASLVASNGGIFYSTASAGAILAGTATANKMLLSGATAAPTWSTSTIPSSAGATANKVLLSDGTNYVLSTPTFPNASATTGKIIISDGTNWIASTPTYPASAGTAGNVLTSDGTNWTSSPSAGGDTITALSYLLIGA